jgi:hypothetical protein
MEFIPIRFIDEPIEAVFDHPPVMQKRPGCPDGFIWEGKQISIVDVLSEWHDYERRGATKHNMRPEHAAAAQKRGSWGVGRDYYRVRTDDDAVYDIYYDRAPKGVSRRKGGWILFREVRVTE